MSERKPRGRPFKPGESGNPAGRRPGAPDRRNELKELLGTHSQALIEAAVAQALNGETSVMVALLHRLVPVAKSARDPIELPALAAATTPADQARAIVAEVAAGRISPDVAAELLAGVANAARIVESAELIERIAKLEAAAARRGSDGARDA
ncbi:MAG TPA: DUF5681 domain-containing protein [Rhodanobacteraceae bacterium]|jgi:hypothetical protein|nr:DUF5681 domain-containing protein [Rhodanobacteraceae bacterium]